MTLERGSPSPLPTPMVQAVMVTLQGPRNLLPERTCQRGSSCLLGTPPSGARKGHVPLVVPGPPQPHAAHGRAASPPAAKAASAQGNSAGSRTTQFLVPLPPPRDLAGAPERPPAGRVRASFCGRPPRNDKFLGNPDTTGFLGNDVDFLLIKK